VGVGGVGAEARFEDGACAGRTGGGYAGAGHIAWFERVAEIGERDLVWSGPVCSIKPCSKVANSQGTKMYLCKLLKRLGTGEQRQPHHKFSRKRPKSLNDGSAQRTVVTTAKQGGAKAAQE
jgi:hypothetical protein